VLQAVAADPRQRVSALPLLTAAERHQVLVEWNAPPPGVRSQESGVRSQLSAVSRQPSGVAQLNPDSICVQQLFEAQAARTPDAVAVVFDQRPATNDQRPTTTIPSLQPPAPSPQQLTYRELDRRANQ